MRPEASREGRVGHHVPVTLPHAKGELHVARHRRGSGAALDDRADAFELLAVGRADAEFACGPFGDDVDGLASVRDIPVDADAIVEMNALPVDQTERIEARGESAGSGVWGHRSVRRGPAKLEHEPYRRERRMHQQIAIERVKHHRDVHPLEDARPDHLDLAAATLLGRRSEEDDVPADGIGDAGCGDERADRPGRDQVVPARVTHAGQRVVLGENGRARTPARSTGSGVRARTNGRRHPGDATLDPVPSFRQEVRDPSAGFVLLEAELRVCMDPPGEGKEVTGTGVHRAVD